MIYSWLQTSECNILNEVLEHTFCCSKFWWTAARIGGLYWWTVARLSRHTPRCLKWRADPVKLADHSLLLSGRCFARALELSPRNPYIYQVRNLKSCFPPHHTTAVTYLHILHSTLDRFDLRLCDMYVERPADFPDFMFHPSKVLHGGQSDT